MNEPQVQLRVDTLTGRTVLIGTMTGLDALKHAISGAQRTGSAAYGDRRSDDPHSGVISIECVVRIES